MRTTPDDFGCQCRTCQRLGPIEQQRVINWHESQFRLATWKSRARRLWHWLFYPKHTKGIR